MREQYMRTGDGFLVVYSVTDRASYDHVPEFQDLIRRVKEEQGAFPALLVANKVDLAQQRVVSEREGRDMAQQFGVPYIETSAKDPPRNVDKAFQDVVRLIRRQQPVRPSSPRGQNTQKCCQIL